jgi:hypothetical protein
MPSDELSADEKNAAVEFPFFNLRASIALFVCGTAVCSMFDRSKSSTQIVFVLQKPRSLTRGAGFRSKST